MRKKNRIIKSLYNVMIKKGRGKKKDDAKGWNEYSRLM